MNFPECVERIYKTTVLWSARDGDPVCGYLQSYDLVLQTTRTGLLHHAYHPKDRRLERRRDEALRMIGRANKESGIAERLTPVKRRWMTCAEDESCQAQPP